MGEAKTRIRERASREERASSRQQGALQELDNRKNRLLAEYQWSGEKSFSTFFAQLDTHDRHITEACQRAQDTLSKLRARAELADRARQLTPGEACPLCGATHHPSVTHSESVHQAMGEEEQALEGHRQQARRLNQLSRAIAQLHSDYQGVSGRLEEMQRQQQAITDKLEAHEAAFSWEAYRQQPLEESMAQAQKQQQQESEQKELRIRRTQGVQQREQQEKLGSAGAATVAASAAGRRGYSYPNR